MKHVRIAALLLASMTSPAQADEESSPVGLKQAMSYSFGYDMGRRFRKEEVEVDPEALARGLKEALEGKEIPFAEKDFRKALSAFQGEMRVKQEKGRRRAAVENLAAGKAYQAEYGKKPGATTLPSGLQYRVINAGKGPKPTAASAIVYRSRGVHLDGAEFENTGEAPAQVARLATLVAGVREALLLMPEGSKWEVVVPPSLGYGDRGSTAGVGPNATLVYELELLGVR